MIRETGDKLMNKHKPDIKIGVSSCLLGHNVRFDGGHKRHSYIESTLGQYFSFVPFCPETEIGLGIPRAPIRLQMTDNEVRCVGTGYGRARLPFPAVPCYHARVRGRWWLSRRIPLTKIWRTAHENPIR